MGRPTMRLPVLLAMAYLAALPLHAQLLAGEVPPGAIAIEIDELIALPNAYTEDSVLLETDCDDSFDLSIALVHGMPALDLPNLVMLRTLDDDLELCRDAERPHYYAFGEPLACTGTFSWQSANVNTLGDHGGFGMIGPEVVDSQYIAIRQGALTGWILLSFDLMATVPTLHVHRALSLCMSTAVDGPGADRPVAIVPTVTHGGPVRIGVEGAHRMAVCDAAGRTVARYGPGVREIPAPAVAGVYVVRIEHADGTWSFGRFVRQ
ncbi:MAG: hypothetical protein IT228_14020 [Flavobacteriales bacterium]|nr:hypothetical protein [Flavobacteriales bacterium]NUQ13872.1 hypothetical protein [Flavobacteriales bacterium]